MLLVSQNLVNYDMPLPSNITLRVNLAWVSDYKQLSQILEKSENDFFLDVPLGRLKPPNNIIPLEKVKEFVKKYPKIKYLAISNVESDKIIKKFISLFGEKVKIVAQSI